MGRGIFQREGRWWIRWQCQVCGLLHREPVGSYPDAIDAYHHRKYQTEHTGFCLTAARATRRQAHALTFAQAAEEYERWYAAHWKAPRSLHTALVHLGEAFGRKRLHDLAPEHIEAYKTTRAAQVRRNSRIPKPIKPSTINRELDRLQGFFTWAIKRRYVSVNPTKGIQRYPEPPRKDRVLAPEEEVRLLAILPDAYRVPAILAVYAGLRLGEVKTLRWSEIDFEAGTIRLPETKAGKVQYAYMNRLVTDTFQSIPRTSPLVFPDFPKHFSDGFVALAKRAAVHGLTFHDLRRTFASRLTRAGVGLQTVQEAGRWADIGVVVSRYSHLGETQVREAVDRLLDTPRRDTATRTTLSGTPLTPQELSQETVGGGVWGSNPPTRY